MSDRHTSLQSSERSAIGQTPLKVVDPQSLYERVNQLNESIARRAFEMFEQDGGMFGRDLDHWFRAEAEMLHPTHVSIAESDDAVTVDAEVPGFSPNELQVSLEPRTLTISGKKESRREGKENRTVYQEQCASEILRVIELPTEIDVSKATATLKNGTLELRLPKTTDAGSKQQQMAKSASASSGS